MKNLQVFLLTCIINSIPHLETTDRPGFIFVITFEDELQTQSRTIR